MNVYANMEEARARNGKKQARRHYVDGMAQARSRRWLNRWNPSGLTGVVFAHTAPGRLGNPH